MSTTVTDNPALLGKLAARAVVPPLDDWEVQAWRQRESAVWEVHVQGLSGVAALFVPRGSAAKAVEQEALSPTIEEA